MRSSIPESLLEMHYFHVVRDNCAQVLGHEGFHIFKPSTRTENWFGFDQAYFTAKEPTSEITGSIRSYLHQRHGTEDFHLRAYFLQFKVVRKLHRRSSSTPAGWTAPYYRSTLSLAPRKETGISQHETLMRASSIVGATACYVCPMIFTEDDVKRDAVFSDLRMVDITTARNGWTTNEKHHISFEDPDQAPFWCSEPTPAKLMEFDDLVRSAEVFTPKTFEGYVLRLRSALGTERAAIREANSLPMSMTVVAARSKA